MIRRLLLAALLLGPALAHAALPAPYSAHYDLWRNGARLGTATVVFKVLPDGRYELVSDSVGSAGLAAIAGASVKERSVLRWTGQQPETVSYTYRQQLAWKTRERSIEVDAKAGRIEVRDRDRIYSPPFRPGVLDRSAITVALMHDLATGKTGDLTYPVPNRDKLETQVYRVMAPERLNTALGLQRVLRVERIRETANGRSTILWLGQDKNLVPLKIQQSEADGTTIEMRVVSVR